VRFGAWYDMLVLFAHESIVDTCCKRRRHGDMFCARGLGIRRISPAARAIIAIIAIINPLPVARANKWATCDVL